MVTYGKTVVELFMPEKIVALNIEANMVNMFCASFLSNENEIKKFSLDGKDYQKFKFKGFSLFAGSA